MNRLDGQRVWITGASKGIGRALAEELARRGARTVLTARNETELEEVASVIRDAGGHATVQPGDVCDLDRMKEIVANVEAEYGGIDMLIANAGTHIESAPERFSTEEYMRLMDINYGGMLRCIEACLPGMIERQSGRIVGMSSLVAYRAVPLAAAYGGSKAAITNFLQSMRFHLEDCGVEVTVISPGFVRTPLTDKNKFGMPFLVEAPDAARTICKGLAKGHAQISFPMPFTNIIGLMRVLPYPIYHWIMRFVWNRLKRANR